MKKLLKITTTFALILFFQNTFAQGKESTQQENILNLSAKNTKRNIKEKTIIYDGNVNFQSKFISFDNAERVVIDEKTSIIKIYNAENFKVTKANSITRNKKQESDFITYNYKENTVIL